MGLARQLKDELDDPPPVLLSSAAATTPGSPPGRGPRRVVSHPIDAVQIAQAVTSLLTGDAGPVAAAH